MLKIGLDIDDVLADFINSYYTRFGYTTNSQRITRHCQRVLKHDKDFWLNLPVLRTLNFVPTLYCSKRVNPKRYTKEWLRKNNFPEAPLYQMFYQGGNKATMIKGRVDVFIDDSIYNMEKMNASGVVCLLMDSPENRHYECPNRVYSLDINEITKVYNEFIKH